MIKVTDFSDLRYVLNRAIYEHDPEGLVKEIANLVLLSQIDSNLVKQAQEIVGGN